MDGVDSSTVRNNNLGAGTYFRTVYGTVTYRILQRSLFGIDVFHHGAFVDRPVLATYTNHRELEPPRCTHGDVHGYTIKHV